MKRSRDVTPSDAMICSRAKLKRCNQPEGLIEVVAYLDNVREACRNDGDKYLKFLLVMKDFRDRRIGADVIEGKVVELFRGNLVLILGFKTFLSGKAKIKHKSLSMEEDAEQFILKLKTLHSDKQYKAFLNILNMYRKDLMSISEVYQEVALLFREQRDVLEDFKHFLPCSVPLHHASSGRVRDIGGIHLSENDGRFTLSKLPQNQDERKIGRIINFNASQDLNVHDPNFVGEESFKASEQQAEHVDEETELEGSQYGGHLCDDDGLEHDSSKAFNAGANIKIKENGNSQDNCKELKHDTGDVLDDKHLSLNGEQKLVQAVDVHNSEQLHQGERPSLCPKTGLSKQENTLDVVLSDCQSFNPSYHWLEKTHETPSVKSKKDSELSVLNDEWIIKIYDPDNTSGKSKSIGPYEEALFSCEDDRYEMDMLIGRINSTIDSIEELLALIKLKVRRYHCIKANKLSKEALNQRCIERLLGEYAEDIFDALREPFKILAQRCIERLYGYRTEYIFDALRKAPGQALPVILTRLREKQEDCLRHHSYLSELWTDVYASESSGDIISAVHSQDAVNTALALVLSQ